MSEVSVDIGAMPVEYAEAARLALKFSLGQGIFWQDDTYRAASAVTAMLDFKIGMAKKEAAA